MFQKWRIGNFKSVYEDTEIDMMPLTIFVGTNSSGKSTFLQSMLLVAQTISNQVYSKSIILNGHITRLGNFDDLASKNSQNKDIRIGFKIDPSRSTDSSFRRSQRVSGKQHGYRYYAYDATTLSWIDCDFFVAANDDSIPKEIQQLQPQLVRCRLAAATLDGGNVSRVSIERTNKSIEDRKKELNLPTEYRDLDGIASLKYRVLEPIEYRNDSHQHLLYYDMPKDIKIAGSTLSHFIPTSLSCVYDSVQEHAKQIVTGFVQGVSSVEFEDIDQPFLNEKFLKRLYEILRESAPDLFQFQEKAKARVAGPPNPQKFSDVIARAARVKSSNLEQFAGEFERTPSSDLLVKIFRTIPSRASTRNAITEHMDELINLAIGDQKASLSLRMLPLPGYTQLIPSFLQTFFVESFKYLGPLRDEPKAFYPLEGSTNPSDVGLKGEYTAAVLDLHKGATINYIPSLYFADFEKTNLTAINATLQTAVIDWLKYMGVVQEVQTSDRGIFGHELKVAIDAASSANSLHNLTHVGVGVSQLLPILVMSLLAEPGSVLVFEQPEIHLHPKVQTLLADFLLSLSMNGKQCIVETHSEYLINRIRYRTVLDKDKKQNLVENVRLYFVEKHDGKSSYRPVRINEFGAIPDWPEGFFDESQREVERILRAALEKRRSSR